MVKEKRLKQFGEMEGAPDWYGTPLDELHFEWSPEEKLEIERYCEKIMKNVEEEGGMTPLERLKATFEGKPRDRVSMYVLYGNVYGTRVLDSGADAIKPIDIHLYPKLWVKIHLANVARFKMDYANPYPINYGEEMWRGNAQMMQYASPAIAGEPKIKSMEDLEGLEVPDPGKDGLYPGYLWANRELRRIYDEYGLSKVMPIFARFCADPHYHVMMFMQGWATFFTNLRKNPEFCRKCLDLATEFQIRYGQAMLDAARPEAMYMCSTIGAHAIKSNEWLADYWAKVGKALAPQAPFVYAYSFGLTTQWVPIMWERGALGPGSFSGGLFDSQVFDAKTMIDLSQKYDLWVASTFSDTTLLSGPVSAIEEEIKHLYEIGKSYPRFTIAIGMCDYWTPPSHLDAAIAAAKEYGKY